MMTLFFHSHPVRNWSDADRCDRQQFARYFWGLIAEGIYMPCSQFEALFFGCTHTAAMIDETIDATARVLRRLAA
jgi:glutamate-1-semialdehyde 2,1-aminomutase